MRRYSGIIFPIAILILIKFIFLFPLFDSLEFKAQDTLFRLRGVKPISGEVVVVAIDDETFAALDETWPFPREYYAKLIENLNQAGARLIVFDVEFTENSNPESDEALAEAAARYNNVIFAGKVLHAKTPRDPNQKLTPIQTIMRRNLSWGIVNMYSDVDNVIRKYTLYDMHDQTPVYSIGVAALANYRVYQPEWESHIKSGNNVLSLTDKKIPLYHQNKALINYYGPAQTFPQYSLSTILDDDTMSMPGYMGIEMDEYYDILASGELKNKIVLIGATVDELHDKFPTPFGGEWTPG
ncbi:MAG TPA: CHASE2 domain-containing protein, partial [Candidatus Cloacimonadota bacterium]|nr:CHASE2 domain-containing protein [Candidatus Cloacimonadota bacterium]